MKIHPPTVTVDEAKPFGEALFGREDFANSLTQLLRNVAENLVIFVHAPWGEGKTTFARMWQAQLRLKRLDSIYFDAYSVDYFEDPFVSFTGEIWKLLNSRLDEGKGLVERQAFAKKAAKIGKQIGGLAFRIGLRAGTAGLFNTTDFEAVKSISSDAADDVSKSVEEIIADYTSQKDTITAFQHRGQFLFLLFKLYHYPEKA